MPSWQASKAPQAHVRTGTCWCGYINGRIGRDTKDAKTSGVFSGVRQQ